MAKKVKKSLFSRIKEFGDVIAAISVVGAALMAVGTWCMSQANAGVNKKLDDISSQVQDLKLDTTRNELLTLIKGYPDNEEEILKVGKHYFRDLNGDWYMTSLFTRWAANHNIDITDIVKVKGD